MQQAHLNTDLSDDENGKGVHEECYVRRITATGDELNPGNRVEGLGNFGKPTGEFGTVKQANDEDAIVKWDDDGRHRLGQRWLKKV